MPWRRGILRLISLGGPYDACGEEQDERYGVGVAEGQVVAGERVHELDNRLKDLEEA